MRLFEIEDSRGSYAAVKFDPTTVKALEAYQYDNNIPNALSADDFHSTVMFSRNYIPEFKVLEGPLDWQGTFRKFTSFPSDDTQALVLIYDCWELEERFDKIMDEYDATWDHDDFHPHITLSYDLEDLDIKSLPKYEGPIIIVEEYADDLDLSVNWADQHK
jgi:hypothetical protein